MIVLGLILILLAAGAIVLISLEESTTASTASLTVFDYTFQPNHLEMYLAGAATAGVLLLGLAMIGSGYRRSSHRRRQMREARVEAHDRVARLEDEKRRLERKLTESETTPQVPRQHDGGTPPPPPPSDDRLVAGPATHRRPGEPRV